MGRKKQVETSLELFLDTICNTFGGILFIAILVTILIRLSSEKIQELESESPSSRALEVAQIRSEIEELGRQLDREQKILTVQQTSFQVDENDSRKKLMQKWTELTQAENEKSILETKNLKEVADIAEQIAYLEDEKEKVTKDNDHLKKELLKMSEEVQKADKEHNRRLTLPRQTKLGEKPAIALIVRYNRVISGTSTIPMGTKKE